MNKITVVISTYNEEKNIKDCLLSVKWADEIIVVDGKSQDKTKEIALELGAKVYSVDNNLMLNINKNYGFDKSSGEWILSLDADERISEELKRELLENINNKFVGYRIPRKNTIFGKWIQYGLWWPDFQVRFFKKEKGKFPCKHVHEYLMVEGEIGELKNPLIHYNYTSISQFLHKLDTVYTENEVDNFIKTGKQIAWQDAIRWPIRDFLKIFFAQRGYKDGVHGLVLAMLQAFYNLVFFAKIWESQGFKENTINIKELEKEIKILKNEETYWLTQTEINNSNNLIKRTWLKIKRKIW